MQDLPDRDGVLALLAELRPVPCDRVVQGQLAPLGQLMHEQGDERLAGREDPEQRIRPATECPIKDDLSLPQHAQLRDGAASPHQVHAVGQCRCIDTNIFWWRLHPIDHT
jgi:hypothetical protein